MTKLLEVRDLSVAFYRYRAFFKREEITRLEGLSFALEPGEVMAVIGSSGAGKSLLALALLGLLPPNAGQTGTIRFRGRDMDAAGLARLRAREIGLVPQQVSHLDPLARTGAQIGRAAARASVLPRISERLVAVGLQESAARLYPHQLSGGMARRVMVCAAEIGSASVLVADEPTAGLDAANRDIVLSRLRARADRGSAVLLISHDLVSVLPFADRVLLLEDGFMRGEEPAARFSAAGARALSDYASALWRALPQNGFAGHA
ncbi:ATP-binding cassette domain-containing protein [Pontibaca methylaminivorans]|uniref:ATP-binding cassette domain-containing protein n=1 Tax=Pontibaca methylaminivorans TaxID=515897 RepID=UPI002FD974B0